MNVSIPVDAHDPGQVLACLGMVEVLVLLGQDPTSWFDLEDGRFHLSADDVDPVRLAVATVMEASVVGVPAALPPEVVKGDDAVEEQPDPQDDDGRGDDEEPEAEAETKGRKPKGGKVAEPPVTLRLPGGSHEVTVLIDMWGSQDGRPPCEFHAGVQTGQGIVRDVLTTLALLRGVPDLHLDPLSHTPGVPRKVSRYGLDTRTGRSAVSNGWSPNAVGVRSRTYPLVEVLSLIGAQSVRLPERRVGGKRHVLHGLWRTPLPPTLARHALVCAFPTPRAVTVSSRKETNGKASSLVRGGVSRGHAL